MARINLIYGRSGSGKQKILNALSDMDRTLIVGNYRLLDSQKNGCVYFQEPTLASLKSAIPFADKNNITLYVETCNKEIANFIIGGAE